MNLWSTQNGATLRTVIERQQTSITLPLSSDTESVALISGELPPGMFLVEKSIKGTPFEVAVETVFTFVLRATKGTEIEDRTLEIIVDGADSPQWITQPGLLPLKNEALFILDNEPVDFQLQAIDPDLPAGDVLTYSLVEGTLPPGLQLTSDGKLVGVVEPILALDKQAGNGAYDTGLFDKFPLDFGFLSDNGYTSFFYDITGYDFATPRQFPKKLNRYYNFVISVTDGDETTERDFRVFVVGDDFLTADNTLMRVANGIFTADATNVRTPLWVTPANLGFKRANNYFAIPLEVVDTELLRGIVVYSIVAANPDGTVSKLPDGCEIDPLTGIIYGEVPYSPKSFEEYNFTIRATRFSGDTEIAFVTAVVAEDTPNDVNQIKVNKISRSDTDGIDDINELLGSSVEIDGFIYKITAIDETQSETDILILDRGLLTRYPLIIKDTIEANTKSGFVQGTNNAIRDRYIGSSITSGRNKYTVKSLYPYIKYRIKETNLSELEINETVYPRTGIVNSVTVLDPGLNHTSADISFSSTSGFGATATANIDDLGRIISISLDSGGQGYTTAPEVIINGEFNFTQIPASARANLTFENFNEHLERILGQQAGPPIVEKQSDREYVIYLPNTQKNRNKDRIREIFERENSNLTVTIEETGIDRLEFVETVQSSLAGDISTAVFAGTSFQKQISTVSDSEIDNPFTDKTFTLTVLGDVDSDIQFITDSDLGKLRPNFVSRLQIETSTTGMKQVVYTLVDGKLPNGITLSYDGSLVGVVKVLASETNSALTVFDIAQTTFDAEIGTTFDRRFSFTVKAQDRFGFNDIEKEFSLEIDDTGNLFYSNLLVKPFLDRSTRSSYKTLISDPEIIPPSAVYRPNDPSYGIRRELEMLVYSGIQTKNITEYVAAAAKNHRKKQMYLGSLQKAEARETGLSEPVYEIIYATVNDQQDNGNTTSLSFKDVNSSKITVDSIEYSVIDDVTKFGAGYDELPVGTRYRDTGIPIDSNDFDVVTNSGIESVDISDGDIDVELRNGDNVEIEIQTTDSEPYRLRPNNNTVKADSDALTIDSAGQTTYYISNISNMRDRISKLGITEGEFLPLWMRTRQNFGDDVPGYKMAVPIVYCKPGTGDQILQNLRNADFDFTTVDFTIDRYIIDNTLESSQPQYVLFPNYKFNV